MNEGNAKPGAAPDPDWIARVVGEALSQASQDTAEPVAEPSVRDGADQRDIAGSERVRDAGTGSPTTATEIGATTTNTSILATDPPPLAELVGELPESPIVGSQPEPQDAELDDLREPEDVNLDGFAPSRTRVIAEWAAVLLSALVVALLIKTLILQSFWIPSASMATTLNEGDRILVNKLSYRLHDVRRGDLVVFEKPSFAPGQNDDLIKRAIALPGETIEVRSDGRLYIWGPGETAEEALLLEEPYLDPQNSVLRSPSLSDPVTADIWSEGCANRPRTPGRCTLGEEQYFMMGDNRMASADSRSFGPVDEEQIIGRAFARFWPLSEIGSL